MGWAGGANLYREVIEVLKHYVPDAEKRRYMHKELIAAFEGEDWDTQDECLGLDPAFDRALERRDDD